MVLKNNKKVVNIKAKIDLYLSYYIYKINLNYSKKSQ